MTTARARRLAALLATGLLASACGLDFSTPRAYRCSSDEECRAGWRCLGDSYCHDPAVGVATPCGVDGDCAGGWRCLGDQQCHDPAVGVATGCSTDADCAGGWECLGDKLCHDGTVGVTLACVTDGDCAAGWKCLGDKLCHDPDAGASTPCLATADCAGGWRCADRLCRDPSVGVTVPCATSADCLGGWFCGRDKVCRDPLNPGPFPCAVDAECAGGWRCSSEGVCTDAAAELAAVPPIGALPSLTLISPLTERPSGLRAAAAAFSATDAGFGAVVSATTVGANGLLVTALRSERAFGDSTFGHSTEWTELPLGTDAGVVLDVLSTVDVTLVMTEGPVVWRSLRGQPLSPLALGVSPQRLISFPWSEAPGQVRPLLAVVTEAELVVAWPDGGVSSWGDGTGKARIVDVASTRDGGAVAVAWTDGTSEFVGVGAVGQTLNPAAAEWSGGASGGLELTWLRSRGDVLAGAWKVPQLGGGFRSTASVSMPASIDGGATPPIFAYQEYATLLTGIGLAIPRGFVTVECSPGETLEDLEVVETGGEVGLEIACRHPSYEELLVYVATPLRARRLVLERRSVLHDGLDGTHASVTAHGVVRFTDELSAPDVSTLLSVSPSVLGRVDRYLVAVAGAQVYGHEARGLALAASETDPLSVPVGLVEQSATLVVGYGAGLDFSTKPPQLRFALEGTPSLRRARGRQFGQATLVSGDDTLYAGTLRDAGVAVLRSVLRPAPGFPVEDWVVRPLDGGYAGWLVANNQLYSLQANTLDRWRSSTWPVSGRDVLGVWWAGGVARVGTTSGEVFSLPSRVPVAPALPGGVTSIAGHCGDVVAVANDALLRLGADAGWAALDASVPRALRQPRLVETDEGLFVVDEDGVVFELAFTTGADGGCP